MTHTRTRTLLTRLVPAVLLGVLAAAGGAAPSKAAPGTGAGPTSTVRYETIFGEQYASSADGCVERYLMLNVFYNPDENPEADQIRYVEHAWDSCAGEYVSYRAIREDNPQWGQLSIDGALNTATVRGTVEGLRLPGRDMAVVGDRRDLCRVRSPDAAPLHRDRAPARRVAPGKPVRLHLPAGEPAAGRNARAGPGDDREGDHSDQHRAGLSGPAEGEGGGGPGGPGDSRAPMSKTEGMDSLVGEKNGVARSLKPNCAAAVLNGKMPLIFGGPGPTLPDGRWVILNTPTPARAVVGLGAVDRVRPSLRNPVPGRISSAPLTQVRSSLTAACRARGHARSCRVPCAPT